MTRFQALEYITSQNLDRRAFELCNAIRRRSGAIGAWHGGALVEVGGYSGIRWRRMPTLLCPSNVAMARCDRAKARGLTEAPETCEHS